MATSFSEVYCQSQILKTDIKLNNLPKYLYDFIYFEYLKYAISLFQYDCNPPSKVLEYTEHKEQQYKYVGDGVETQFELDPIPLLNGKLYVGIRVGDGSYIETTDYTLNAITNIITFKTAPVDMSDILIVSYITGEFKNDLNLREITILAEGCNVPYLASHKNNPKVMNSQMYGSAFKMHSPANSLDKNIINVDNQREWVKELITEYSYKGNGENYKGLGGRRY